MFGRFFRIYPVYFVCLLLSFSAIGTMSSLLVQVPWHEIPAFKLWLTPALTAQAERPFTHLLTHLTLLFGVIPENFLPVGAYTILGPAWSITLEWQFYILAPLLARLVFSRSGWLGLGLVGAGGFLFARFWSSSFLPNSLSMFLIGIGSYHLYTNGYRWKMAPNLVALAVVITIASVIIISWHWMALSVWAAVFGCLLLEKKPEPGQDFVQRWLGNLRRLLLKPTLQWLGQISYPIYLVHWPLIVFLLAGLLHFQPDLSQGAALAILMAAGLPVIILASWLLHQWIEKPLMQFGRKFTK
jgi:peptidoglycan/LPS O-acetylase OafA/YrhL